MATKKRDSSSHDEVVSEMLRTDPEFRAAMINEVMSDGDYADMLILLRQLTLAEGGMKVIAQRTGLNETALYRLMSAEGNPSLKNFSKVLDSLNLQLAVIAKRETFVA
jgi:probable addiction module antidote protein